MAFHSNREKNISISSRDWTKGSILKNLLMLSWPMMISQFLNMIGPTIDMIWVGKLGAAPIAGVGVAGMVVMFAMGAILTPPDVISQILLAVPLLILYESGIWISWLVVRRRRPGLEPAATE